MAEERSWKFRLIEEVRKRPMLWSHKSSMQRNYEERDKLWSEIGELLDMKACTCKQTWSKLRVQFHNELTLIENRVAKAKRKGLYDPQRKYYSWMFFDNLRFIVDETKFNLRFPNNSDTVPDTNDNADADLDESDSKTPGSSLDQEHKFRLIKEVQKRPALWDKLCIADRSVKKRQELWTEIGQILNTEVLLCKETWSCLRLQFRNEVELIKNRIANAKRNDSYIPHKKYYNWIFFDSLRFIGDGKNSNFNFENSSDIETDPDKAKSKSLQLSSGLDQKQKFQLIEEIRKRPELWDYKNIAERTQENRQRLWMEIGQALNTEVVRCKQSWSHLRHQFRNEVGFIKKRIASAKKHGSFNPRKKYYRWIYFDSLRSIYGYKFNLSLGNNCDFNIAISSNTDQIRPDLVNSDSSLPEYINDRELMESENDMEFIDNDSLEQTLSPQENCFEKDHLPKPSDGLCPITAANNKSEIENSHLKSYSFAIGSCAQDNECGTNSNHNTVLKIDSALKEEPELHTEEEKNHSLKNKAINHSESVSSLIAPAGELNDCPKNFHLIEEPKENELNDLEEFISCPPDANYVQSDPDAPPSTVPEEHISNLFNLNDEDYIFLCSFVTQMRAMNPVQKMEFRMCMQTLLADLFPASASVNILEKHLMLPEIRDPDKKFLISFWPFLKSMSMSQNLQFRIKMSQLLFQILFTKTI